MVMMSNPEMTENNLLNKFKVRKSMTKIYRGQNGICNINKSLVRKSKR